MRTHAKFLNDNKIATAMHQQGLSVSEVAFHVRVPVKQLHEIIDGCSGPFDIRLETLARLAECLGLPLQSLFAQPPYPAQASEPEDVPEVANLPDAVYLISSIYDRGPKRTAIRDLAVALGWTLQRLNAAAEEAQTRLAPSGLKLQRGRGAISIVPAHDHSDVRATIAHAIAESTGTLISHEVYQVAFEAMNSPLIHHRTDNFRDRVTIGTALSLGILETQPRHRLRLSDAARAAFID